MHMHSTAELRAKIRGLIKERDQLLEKLKVAEVAKAKPLTDRLIEIKKQVGKLSLDLAGLEGPHALRQGRSQKLTSLAENLEGLALRKAITTKRRDDLLEELRRALNGKADRPVLAIKKDLLEVKRDLAAITRDLGQGWARLNQLREKSCYLG